MNSLMQLSIVAHSLAAGSDGFSDDSECATDDRRKYSDYDSFTWNGPSFPLPYPDHSYAKRPPTPKTLHGHHKELFSPLSINSNQQLISLGTGSRPPTDDLAPSAVESWEGSVTRCICEFQHDDGYMICCDRCSVWQHVDCMGVDRQNIPETYLCELCKPRVVDKHHAIRCQARKRELLMQKQDSSDTDTEEDTKPRKMVIRRKKGKQNLHHGQSAYRRKQQEISKTATRKQTFRFNPKNKKQSGLRSHSLALSSESRFSVSPTPPTSIPTTISTGNDFATFRLLQPCRNTYTTELKWKLDELFSFLDRGVDMSKYATTIDSYHEFSLVSVSMLQISADIKTQGLEASKDLKYEEPIVEYTGKVLLKEQHIYSGSMNHMLQCSIGGSPGLDVCIDSSHHDNHAKFIRRSANPNAQLRHFFDDNNNLRFCIWSTTNILRGSEVTLPLEFENSTSSRPRLTSLNLDRVTPPEEGQGRVIHQKRRRRRHSARISESSAVSETVADVELFPPKKEDAREEQQVVDVTSLHTPPLTLQQPKLHSPTKRPSSAVQSHLQERGKIPKERKRNESERSNHLSPENSKPGKNLHHVNKTIANNNNSNIVEDRLATKQHKKEDVATTTIRVEESKKPLVEGQDIKKLTREEKKLEAIMKAFERMDKKIERKNQREERKQMAELKTKNHKPKSLVGRRKTMSSLNDLGLRADGSKFEIRPNSSVKLERRKRSSDDDDDDEEDVDEEEEDDDDDDDDGGGGGATRSNFNNLKVKDEGHKTGRNGEVLPPVELKISNKGENKLKRYSGGDEDEEDEYNSDGFKVSNKRCVTRGRHGSVGRKKSHVSKKLQRRSSRLLDDQTKKQKIDQAKSKKSLNLRKNLSKKNNNAHKYVKGIEKNKLKKDRARESLSDGEDDDDDKSVAHDEASGADDDDDGDMKFDHVDNDEDEIDDDDDDEGETKQPLQSLHAFAAHSVFSAGLPTSSVVQTVQPSFDPNQGFAKKRWLRQAINESSESHSSTLESGFATPLKKRRLTVDEDAATLMSSMPVLTSLSASLASSSSLSNLKLASNLSPWLITEFDSKTGGGSILDAGKYGDGKLTLCGDAIKQEQMEKISPQPSMKSSPFLSPSSSPVKSSSPQKLSSYGQVSSVVDVTALSSAQKSVSSLLVSSSPMILHVSSSELKRQGGINTGGTISSTLQYNNTSTTSECGGTLTTFQHVSSATTSHQASLIQPIASATQHVVSTSKLALPRQHVSTLQRVASTSPASSSITESCSSLMPFMGQISEVELINEEVCKASVQSSLDVEVLSTEIISSSSPPRPLPLSKVVSKKLSEKTASANMVACSELSSSPPLISSTSSRILSPPASSSSSLLSPVSPLCLSPSPSSSTVVESQARDPRYQPVRNMCNSVGKKKVSLVEYRNRMKSTSSSSSLANHPTSPVYIAPPTCPSSFAGHDIDLPDANQSYRSDVLTRNLDERNVMVDDSGVSSQKAGRWDFEETAAEKVLTKSLSLTDRLRFEFGLDAPDDENDVTNAAANVDPTTPTVPCTTTLQQLPSSRNAVNSSSPPPPRPSLSSSSSSSSSSHLMPKRPRGLVTSSSSSPRLFQQHHRHHHYHHQQPHRNRQKQFDSCETPLPSSSSAEANYGVASSSYPSRRGPSRDKARHLHRHRPHQDPSPPRSLTSSSKMFQLSRCDGEAEVEEEDPRYSRWGQRSYGSSRSCDSPVRHHHHHQHPYQQRQHYYKRRYLPPDDKHGGYQQRERELVEPRERSQFSRIGQRHMKYSSTNNLGFFRTRFQNSK